MVPTFVHLYGPIQRFFHGEISTKFANFYFYFLKKIQFFFKLPKSYDKFQKVAKNIKGLCFFFLPSYLSCSQIWLNYFLDDHCFGCITKSLRKPYTHTQTKIEIIVFKHIYK